MAIPKTPEKIAIQKAIVCLYLRKRKARKQVARYSEVNNFDMSLSWRDIENEAHNALESVKKVLWHDNWD